MNFPEGYFYSKSHEWIKANDDNTALIGISDFAQGELGDLVYIEVETVGESLDKEEAFGTVEAVKTTSDLYMPVSGEVLEFNPQLDENDGDNPTIINEDPYGEGWIVKIKMADPSELQQLMSPEEYANMVS